MGPLAGNAAVGTRAPACCYYSYASPSALQSKQRRGPWRRRAVLDRHRYLGPRRSLFEHSELMKNAANADCRGPKTNAKPKTATQKRCNLSLSRDYCFLKKKNENRPARSRFRTHGDGPLAFGVSHVMVITHVVPGNARSRDSPGTWSLEAASETLAA